MKNLLLSEVNRYRLCSPEIAALYGNFGDAGCGAFMVPSAIDRVPLPVLASTEGGWDHVSVSRKGRTPNWPEMDAIFRLFFEDGEDAMQLHVPAGDHVNVSTTCLHLWRPHAETIPRPPSFMVGPVDSPLNRGVEAAA